MERKLNNHEIGDDTAIVSFADSEDEFINFPKNTNVLKIPFSDIRPYTTVEEHYANLLPEAPKIAEFIDANLKKNRNIICQCDYGVSRSAGLAAAIMEHYKREGIKVFADYRYTPNQFVFNKVLTALNLLNKKTIR